jgi:hypothetical protein
MIKDIDISHYYKKFIETSNDDMAKYNKYVRIIQVIKDDLKINLNEYGFQYLYKQLLYKYH